MSPISWLAFWIRRWKYEFRAFWPCLKCRKLTKSWSCENCGEWYCLNHCEWDNESSWEYTCPDYPICPHCLED